MNETVFFDIRKGSWIFLFRAIEYE